MSSIPGLGTKILPAIWYGQKRGKWEKKKKSEVSRKTSKGSWERGADNNNNNRTPPASNRQELLLLTLRWLWTILVGLFSLQGSCPLFWSGE